MRLVIALQTTQIVILIGMIYAALQHESAIFSTVVIAACLAMIGLIALTARDYIRWARYDILVKTNDKR